jgi:hypothetical protein
MCYGLKPTMANTFLNQTAIIFRTPLADFKAGSGSHDHVIVQHKISIIMPYGTQASLAGSKRHG